MAARRSTTTRTSRCSRSASDRVTSGSTLEGGSGADEMTALSSWNMHAFPFYMQAGTSDEPAAHDERLSGVARWLRLLTEFP